MSKRPAGSTRCSCTKGKTSYHNRPRTSHFTLYIQTSISKLQILTEWFFHTLLKVMSNEIPIDVSIMLLLVQGITKKIFANDRNAIMKKRTADYQLDPRPVAE